MRRNPCNPHPNETIFLSDFLSCVSWLSFVERVKTSEPRNTQRGLRLQPTTEETTNQPNDSNAKSRKTLCGLCVSVVQFVVHEPTEGTIETQRPQRSRSGNIAGLRSWSAPARSSSHA